MLEGNSHGKLYLPSGMEYAGNAFVYLPVHEMPVDVTDESLGTIDNTECAGTVVEHPHVIGTSQRVLSCNVQNLIRGFVIDFEYVYDWVSEDYYETIIFLINLSTYNLKLRLQPHIDNNFTLLTKINTAKSLEWNYFGGKPQHGYTGSLYLNGVDALSMYPNRGFTPPVYTDRSSPSSDAGEWQDRDGMPDEGNIYTNRRLNTEV